MSLDYTIPKSEIRSGRFVLEGNTWVPERTCYETKVHKWWRGCDQCGYNWEFMYGIGEGKRPTYCPQCGAKVVEQ